MVEETYMTFLPRRHIFQIKKLININIKDYISLLSGNNGNGRIPIGRKRNGQTPIGRITEMAKCLIV